MSEIQRFVGKPRASHVKYDNIRLNWSIRLIELIDKNLLRGGLNIQKGELQVKGILAQDLVESRRGQAPKVRSHLVLKLVQELGIPLAEIARQLGVSTSAISQIIRRKQQI